MRSIYIKKIKRKDNKKLLRFLSIGVIFFGLLIFGYVAFPFISWQIYFAPAFASADITTPVPKSQVINSFTLGSLLAEAKNTLAGVDYGNARNWFPDFKGHTQTDSVPFYFLSISKLGIENAIVSTRSYDLSTHLVHYGGTAIPPDRGNAVIFGHSNLPQLFDAKNYKTIFANLYTLKMDDEIRAEVSGVGYLFKIYSITVVDATDTSIFAQEYDSANITLVTCTPPGTTWKRLIIKARLQKLQ